MQFADPAWQPGTTREFEAISPSPPPVTPGGGEGISRSTQAEYQDYAEGYRSQRTPPAAEEYTSQQQTPPPFQGQQPPFQGQPAQPGQAGQPSFAQMLQDLFRRLPAWTWWVIGILVIGGIASPSSSKGGLGGALFSLIFLATLAFLGWLLYTRRMRISLAGEAQTAETRTFTVGAQPLIVLNNKAGSINLRSGEEGQVSITTTRRGYLFSPRLDRETSVMYDLNSAANTLTARTGGWHLFGKNAITFDVVVPPQANLQLTTDFGSINVQNVAGQMTLRTDAGVIQATNVTLQGKSRLKGDAGSINFSGSLDPTGKYEIETDLGTIDATFDVNSSFELTAKTDIGTISSNLPLMQPRRNRLSGNVGPGPHPKLKLKTDIGTITVRRQ